MTEQPPDQALPDLAPMSRQLLDYWRSREAAAGGLPMRGELDVVCDLPRLVAHLLLIDVLSGPAFRFRVIGSTLIERARRNATGAMLDETVYGERLDEVLSPLRETVAQRRPVRMRGYAHGVRLAPPLIESLCVPLAADDDRRRVGFVLCVVSFEAGPTWGEPQHESETSRVLCQDLW